MAKQQQATLDTFVSQLLTEYPILGDVKSREHEEVMVWANHVQATQRVSRQKALEKAVERVFGKAGGRGGAGKDGSSNAESARDRVVRERNEAAVKRGARASRQQPPPMGLGATPNGPAKVDIDNMSEEDFERLPEADKKKLRGDFA